MKIVIPKIVIPVEMAEYSPELAGKFLHVWVNPPKDKLQGYDELVATLQMQELKTAQANLYPDGKKDSEPGLLGAIKTMAHWVSSKKDKRPDGIDVKFLEWYAEIWSQGPEQTRWTVDELRELENQDPAFLSWMITQTWATRTAHVQGKKKA